MADEYAYNLGRCTQIHGFLLVFSVHSDVRRLDMHSRPSWRFP